MLCLLACLNKAVVAREGDPDEGRSGEQTLEVQGPPKVDDAQHACRDLLPLRGHAELSLSFLKSTKQQQQQQQQHEKEQENKKTKKGFGWYAPPS